MIFQFQGENIIRIVKESDRRENSGWDNSIPIRQTHSRNSFMARVKREINGEKATIEPAMEMTKSSQQIQFTPELGYFYGTPGSIDPYQCKYIYIKHARLLYVFLSLARADGYRCFYAFNFLLRDVMTFVVEFRLKHQLIYSGTFVCFSFPSYLPPPLLSQMFVLSIRFRGANVELTFYISVLKYLKLKKKFITIAIKET